MNSYTVKVLVPIYVTAIAKNKADAIARVDDSLKSNRETTTRLLDRAIETSSFERKVVKDDDAGFAAWSGATGCQVTVKASDDAS